MELYGLVYENGGYELEDIVGDVLSLSEKGQRLLCDQVVPPGMGDDSAFRFLIESTSNYLTRDGMEAERAKWEKVCLINIEEAQNIDIKEFFSGQLAIIGVEVPVDQQVATNREVGN